MRLVGERTWLAYAASGREVAFLRRPCDALAPNSRALFGWDVPCPPPSRRSELLAVRLGLTPLHFG